MTDDTDVIVQIDLDVGKIESNLKKITAGIDKIESSVSSNNPAILGAILQVRDTVKSCVDDIIQEIKDNYSSFLQQGADDAQADLGYKLGDWLVQVFTADTGKGGEIKNTKPNKTQGVDGQDASWEIPHYPISPSPSQTEQQRTTQNDKNSSTSGIVSNALSGTGNHLGDIMAFGASADDLVQSIGGVASKLKECAMAWGSQMAAKIADKAVDLQIIALYAVDYIKQFGVMVGQLAASTAAWIGNTAAKVASTAAEWAQIAATTAWNAICTAATAVTTALGAAMTFLTSPIGLVVIAIVALIAIVVLLVKNWDTVKAAALSVWEAIQEAFGKAWKWFKDTLLDPLVNGFKSMVNGVIGFINGLIAGAVKGINGIINVLNKLKFTVPDWVPGLGGATIGFNLKTVTAPQIPYLAKGAVLPANRPFLAMVGDQRHGTNIEAPLATIQEAMALTMEDFVASNMAGHEATVGVLREILGAVLGIHIGDAVIAQAAERYRSKMAVVRGGSY